MKQIYILLTLLILLNVSAFAQYTDCSEVPAEDIGGKTCVEWTECGQISANTYNLLINDVSSAGTCFTMYVSNADLNLNGYTVNYAITEPGNGVYLGPWGYNENLKIFNGQIHGGNQTESHIIHLPDGARDNIQIYNLNTSSQGLQTAGIVLRNSFVDLSIHDVNISLKGQKEDPCSHYGGHIAGIGVTNPGGKVEYYNNRIVGEGMVGITITDCSNSFSEPARVYNNYISMWSPVRDGYAISVASRNNQCSDGTLIYNNVIDQINGRGIAVAGWDSEADHGPGNVEIFNNNITVREGWDCEYDGSGTAVGVRIRFGAHDNYVHDNNIYGFAGVGVANGSHPTKDGSKVIGFYIGAAKPYGKNNTFENNYVDISTNDAEFFATGIYISDSSPPATGAFGTYWENNTIKTNSIAIDNEGYDAQGFNALFVNTTIIKGDNPLGFTPTELGGWAGGAENLTFLDTIGVGTSIHEITFNTDYDNRLYTDVFFKWTLTVIVEDSDGNAIQDALIEIKDNADVVVAQGNSDGDGYFSSILTERTYDDTPAAGNYPDYTEFTPHTITVTYDGETITRDVFMNDTRTETFVFSLGPCEEGITRECGISDVGACSFGTETCTAGLWESCIGSVDPTTEVCDNEADDDCDGLTDYEDTEDCTVPECTLPYDLYPCDCISMDEVLSAMTAWYGDQLGMSSLIEYIKLWKSGVC